MKIQKLFDDGKKIAISRQDLATLIVLADRWIAHLEGEKEYLLDHYQKIGGDVSDEEDRRYCEICSEINDLDYILEPYKELFRK